MIYFDVTKTASAGHRSGLMRVSERLIEELGDRARTVTWSDWQGQGAKAGDWFLTPELFSDAERPGFDRFLWERHCRCAAIFHDAIPLRFPHITWPQSVARHPGYLKMLAGFDRVWAVSEFSRDDLRGFWKWQGGEKTPPVEVLALGADFAAGLPRATSASLSKAPGPARSSFGPALLCVGILEPRKNQLFLLEVAEELWEEGLVFELHIVGRVNPHFGKPVAERIRAVRKRFRGLHFHAAASDRELAELYAASRATVFPTIGEGCGLPLLESLWRGVPCVASDLTVLRENASRGGCVLVPLNEHDAWKAELRRVITDEAWVQRLKAEAVTRPLSTWADAATELASALK
jgi:glycosyltransferase involved in cell wall biosynthesis